MKNKLALLFVFAFSSAFGQEVEMADSFRGEGKIYVVIAVILVILLGFILYLFRLDKKIKKLEKE